MNLRGLKTDQDRYWVGLILLLRRRISRMCEDSGRLSKPSVIRIIDETLPPDILRREKLEVEINTRRRKHERKIKTN
jgi:hypothetical protein